MLFGAITAQARMLYFCQPPAMLVQSVRLYNVKRQMKVWNIIAGELKIWQQKYTNFFRMSGVHIFVALKSLWEYNCAHT